LNFGSFRKSLNAEFISLVEKQQLCRGFVSLSNSQLMVITSLND
jgi:hypothetical protein